MDLGVTTGHEAAAERDYALARAFGFRTMRDGIRWHAIEQRPYRYDFSSALQLAKAARNADVQVVWDLCHYGWPDDLDVLRPEFVDRFASFAGAFARVLDGLADDEPYFAPINEISYLSWAAGETGYFYPFLRGSGRSVMRQLVRATIAATESIRDVAPQARFVSTEPLINIVAVDRGGRATQSRQPDHDEQYRSRDMLVGREEPHLGGAEQYLDIVGVNYYIDNQWARHGRRSTWDTWLRRGDPGYRPLSELLAALFARFPRPIFVAETSIEGDLRPAWLRDIVREVALARASGIPVDAICWYPVVDFLGWDDDRHCTPGLWGPCTVDQARPLRRNLAAAFGHHMSELRSSQGIVIPANGPGGAVLEQPGPGRLDPVGVD